MFSDALIRHTAVIGALVRRETTTRFGRESAGFLWAIGEPLMFCGGVLILWSMLRPSYEHGLRLGPFVMTGYMSLLLMRHMIAFSMSAVQSNVGLLYHRQISVIHIFVARNIIEFLGATSAFVVVYVVLYAMGEVGLPQNWLLLYFGWLLMGWVCFCLAFFLAALSIRYELVEKIVGVMTYALIPVSGAFSMAAWLPEPARKYFLLVPLPHGVEMIRAGVFGEFVETHYNPAYAFACACVFLLFGTILIMDAKDRVILE